MRAWVLSTFLATLVGTAAGMAAWQYDIGGHVWPAHPNLFALFLTLFATVVSQRVWSPDYFKKRAQS
jgi:hypothetical protein